MIAGVGPYLLVQSNRYHKSISSDIISIHNVLNADNSRLASVIVDIGAERVLKDRFGSGMSANDLVAYYGNRYV